MNTKNITNIKFGDVAHSEYPEYESAHIVSAERNGEPLTEEEIEKLNEDRDFVYEELMKHLF